MIRTRVLCVGMLAAGFSLALLPVIPGAVGSAWAQERPEPIRPDVGKPLQAAQELMRAQKFREALAKIREAENVGGKTAYESFLIERMHGAVAAASGDLAGANQSFEATIASGRLQGADQIRMVEAVASNYYQLKDYPKTATWTQRYFREGGTDPAMRTLLIQSYYLNGEYAPAAKELGADVAALDRTGQKPSEDQLLMLQSCYAKLNDTPNTIATLTKLVARYPKKDYWADVIHKVTTKQGFATERLSLDVLRLRLAAGTLTQPNDYMEIVQLSMEAGQIGEAKKIIDQGFTAGVLGVDTGSSGDRQKRLKDLVEKRAEDNLKDLDSGDRDLSAATPEVQVATALDQVSFGEFDKGIPAIEAAIKKGGFKHIDDAKLHLGLAYLWAGQKGKAIAAFRTVQGTDGAADLAQLWILKANQAQ